MNADTIVEYTDTDIARMRRDMATAHGKNFIPIGEGLTPVTRVAGQALAAACGMSVKGSGILRDHELATFYSVTAKGAAGGRQMARRLMARYDTPEATKAPERALEGISGATQEQITAALAELADSVTFKAETRTIEQIAELEGQLPRLVAAELEHLLPKRIEIVKQDRPPVTIDCAHKAFEEALDWISAGTWPFLVGPAGSGKTTLGEQMAEALSVPFHMAAKVDSKFELMGHIQPHNGEVYRTPFREAYEHGGVFLLDEIDASNAAALNSFNAALAQKYCPFPDGLVKRSPEFYACAAANTFGSGRDHIYVGRNPLDGATKDRFAFVVVDYDEELETRISSNTGWTKYVQAIRAEVSRRAIRHIVSPRASIEGGKAINRGKDWNKVAHSTIWKGLDAETVRQLEAAVPASQYEISIL